MISNSVEFLYGLERNGIKLGLENISALLLYCDNPQKKFHSIHIAGTNGKGSTAALIASVFTAAGYTTGLYTSPHISEIYERITINGVSISPERFSFYVEQFRSEITRLRATFFESLTAIAFQYFAENNVDIAIVETGLGGRLDATNIITPLISVITNVSLEHTEYLGNTIEKIAFEKAGIIKPNVPVVTGSENEDALCVLQNVAQLKKTRVYVANKEMSVQTLFTTIENNIYSITSRNDTWQHFELGFGGFVQSQNCATALLTLQVLKNMYKKRFQITGSHIKDGFKNVKKNTRIFGRLELLQKKPLIVLDVAHNPNAFENLAKSVQLLFPKRGVIVLGMMKDKDVRECVYHLSSLHVPVITVQPNVMRARSSLELTKECHRNGVRSVDGNTVSEGIQIARTFVSDEDFILICGSFYVAEEAMKFFQCV
jgi:dihydrofolate synthase/folylpolyglutamate synthase